MRRLRLGLLLSITLVHGYQSALDRGKQAYDKDDFATAERAFQEAVKEQPKSAADKHSINKLFLGAANCLIISVSPLTVLVK